MTLTRVRSRPAADDAAGGPRLHVVTFGCQMNKYDSLLVEGRFQRRGYRLTDELGEADVVLFNTCSVRDHAEERTYSWLGELKRLKAERPDVVIGVMGCQAQRAEEEIFARAAHVDVVCGTRRLQHLPELVDEVRARRADPEASGRERARVLDTRMDGTVAVDRRGETYRGGLHGYLAVMRGCDLNCTFCVVPRTRGRVQSRPIDGLVEEARWMAEGGLRAVTLLGQTVNSYGEDLPATRSGTGRRGRPSLADLLRALQEVAGLRRIRLVTLHPAYVTPALAEALRDCDKVDRFLPLPAQSGSDRVLRAMKRGYTTDLYRSKLDVLRAAVPDLELGSDWIVGFPGEEDEDFARTEAFLDEIGTVQNYVFKYDPRPGTVADDRPDDVPVHLKKERNRALLRRGERSALRRHERWIGRAVSVLIEDVSPRDPELVVGRTAHNLPIALPGRREQVGEELRVEVREASPYGLAGAPA